MPKILKRVGKTNKKKIVLWDLLVNWLTKKVKQGN